MIKSVSLFSKEELKDKLFNEISISLEEIPLRN